IADLSYAESKIIYAPESGQEYSKNLWSPEIHYFTEEEAGEGNGGWYCFLGSGGDNDEEGSLASKQRQYVIKCLDGDDLLGRWGNPLTGEENVPQLMQFPDSDYNVSELCGGSSVLRIDGQTYITFISEVGRGTEDFHQTMNIAHFENPWTITGTPVTICEPTEWFEEGGYGYSKSKDAWYPKVVEGATAVYGSDGSVFIVYAGSGYWTTEYCLGQLTYLGGDPMDAANWQKATSPILYKSDEIVGCGHASFVTDESGQGWICYHGYIGTEGSKPAGSRYSFIENYTADAENGVVIADGSGHPAPLSTVQTMDVSPMSLAARITGFDSRYDGADFNADGRVSLLDGLSLLKSVLDGTSEKNMVDIVRLLKIVMA
ncbi:MAG: family 43 glycosylhydrolase, partial [Clostridia bacterium]|nr:family 43 glycosylhydrolase [Clostridia bacterium]